MVLDSRTFVLALEWLTEAAVAGGLSDETAKKIAERLLAGHPAIQNAVVNTFSILEHDGYLSRVPGGFVFASNLVRDWWKRRFGQGYTPVSGKRRK